MNMNNQEQSPVEDHQSLPSGACCPVVSAARGFSAKSVLLGLAAGVLLTAASGWALMPGMMIKNDESRLGFDETVAAIQEKVTEQGWVVSGVRDFQKSVTAQGGKLDHRVKLVEICHPKYASSVLNSDRHLATLMPCALAVYEDDEGRVHVSRMNVGLMGRMFGGNVSHVMAGQVAPDEEAILAGILTE